MGILNIMEDRQHKDDITRRGFVKTLWIALISISMLEVAAVIAAFLSSGGKRPKASRVQPFKVLGKVEDIPKGSVTAFRSDKLYLVRMQDGGFLALSLQCTHLGCAITWNKDRGEFDCPCHASSFSMGGDVNSPPAPRALDTYRIIIEAGLLKADLSKSIKRSSYNPSQLVYA